MASRIGLRAPRAAIIVNGDDDRTFWARMALFEANQLWGRQGFVLVPHHHSSVHPAVLSTVTAYDPHHVQVLRASPAEMRCTVPGKPDGVSRGLNPESNVD